ncbi:hypothetical protein [Bartonella gliris]|uniref:hypothetical protein n=1 Tax=Bartonella gliris TaxID=3004109 RepID=UPI00295F1BBD|nr:hypothetical protein [Bartonella gliris]
MIQGVNTLSKRDVLFSDVEVYDHAEVSENFKIYGNALVSGYAKIFGRAEFDCSVDVCHYENFRTDEEIYECYCFLHDVTEENENDADKARVEILPP